MRLIMDIFLEFFHGGFELFRKFTWSISLTLVTWKLLLLIFLVLLLLLLLLFSWIFIRFTFRFIPSNLGLRRYYFNFRWLLVLVKIRRIDGLKLNWMLVVFIYFTTQTSWFIVNIFCSFINAITKLLLLLRLLAVSWFVACRWSCFGPILN